MSREVITLERNEVLSVADDLMDKRGLRHLPVIDDDGALCGLVTRSDVCRGALVRALGFGRRAEEKMLESIVVKEVMTVQVETTSPEVRLADAAQLMWEGKIGCLPVLEDGQLVGILTEGDFVRLIAGAEDSS